MNWYRTCQECGHVQLDRPPPTGRPPAGPTDGEYFRWAYRPCEKCKSEALDYGSEQMTKVKKLTLIEARLAIKAQLKKDGHKVSDFAPEEIAKAARELMRRADAKTIAEARALGAELRSAIAKRLTKN